MTQSSNDERAGPATHPASTTGVPTVPHTSTNPQMSLEQMESMMQLLHAQMQSLRQSHATDATAEPLKPSLSTTATKFEPATLEKKDQMNSDIPFHFRRPLTATMAPLPMAPLATTHVNNELSSDLQRLAANIPSKAWIEKPKEAPTLSDTSATGFQQWKAALRLYAGTTGTTDIYYTPFEETLAKWMTLGVLGSNQTVAHQLLLTIHAKAFHVLATAVQSVTKSTLVDRLELEQSQSPTKFIYGNATLLYQQLVNKYQVSSRTLVISELNKLFSLTFKPGDDANEFAQRCESIFNQLTLAGHTLTETLQCTFVLRALDKRLEPTLQTLDARGPTLKLTEIFETLRRHCDTLNTSQSRPSSKHESAYITADHQTQPYYQDRRSTNYQRKPRYNQRNNGYQSRHDNDTEREPGIHSASSASMKAPLKLH